MHTLVLLNKEKWLDLKKEDHYNLFYGYAMSLDTKRAPVGQQVLFRTPDEVKTDERGRTVIIGNGDVEIDCQLPTITYTQNNPGYRDFHTVGEVEHVLVEGYVHKYEDGVKAVMASLECTEDEAKEYISSLPTLYYEVYRRRRYSR